MLSKYASRGFVVLAINVEPKDDPFVVPFMKNNRYDFIPLKSNWEWASEHYGVRGTPSNYLVDIDGRIMFKPRVDDAGTRRALEQQIEALLVRASARR